MARILVAASGGGHWDQLMQLREALSDHAVHFATTSEDLLRSADIPDGTVLPDCNIDQPMRSLRCAIAARQLVNNLAPEIVISTGAAPGFFCVLWAKLAGARTLWIDSVANAERLSLSGRLAQRIGVPCLTQWEHLATEGGPHFEGSLL